MSADRPDWKHRYEVALAIAEQRKADYDAKVEALRARVTALEDAWSRAANFVQHRERCGSPVGGCVCGASDAVKAMRAAISPEASRG